MTELTDEQREERIYAPLRMLREATDRLMDRRTPVSQERLDALYRHIAGSIGEVLENTRGEMDRCFQQVQEAGAVAQEDVPDFAPVFRMFEEGREQISAGMTLMAQTFFSSGDFKALERNQGALGVAETHIMDGLNRIEAALMLSEDPALLGTPPPPTAPQIPNALDALACCLETLSTYLEKGERAQLEDSLGHIDTARELIMRALEQG